MTVPEISNIENIPNSSLTIKMNNSQSIRELRALAKGRGVYYTLRMVELVDLLTTARRSPRRARERKHIRKIMIVPKLEDMDKFENQEMAEN